MSRHGPRHRQPPPTPVPAPPTPLYPGAREQLWLFALVLITSAAAVIAIFCAGYAAGAASVAHG